MKPWEKYQQAAKPWEKYKAQAESADQEVVSPADKDWSPLSDLWGLAKKGLGKAAENLLEARDMRLREAASEERGPGGQPLSFAQIQADVGDPVGSALQSTFGDEETGETPAQRLEKWQANIESGLSAGAQDRQKSFFTDESQLFKPWTWTFKEGAAPWEDPMSYGAFIAENAANLAISIGAARVGGRMGGRSALAKLTPAQRMNPAAVREAVQKGATRGGMAAGTATEGIMIRDSVAMQAKDELMQLPEQKWATNEEYVGMVSSGEFTPDEAKMLLSDRYANKYGGLAAILSVPFGAPAAGIFGRRGAGVTVGGRIADFFKSVGTEAGTEGLQELIENTVGNVAVREIDPDRDLTAGGLDSFFGGMIAGGPVAAVTSLPDLFTGEVGQDKKSRSMLDDKDINNYLSAARDRERTLQKTQNERAMADMPVRDKKQLYDTLLRQEEQEADLFLRAEPKLRKQIQSNLDGALVAESPELKALDVLAAKYRAQKVQTKQLRDRLKAERDALAQSKAIEEERQKISKQVERKAIERDDIAASLRQIETVQEGGALTDSEYQNLVKQGYGRWTDKNQTNFVITKQGQVALPALRSQLDEINKGMERGWFGKERRGDLDRRRAIDEMSERERFDAIMKDSATGLLNRRALELDEKSEPDKVVAKIDLDSLKWINDTVGSSAGDDAIKAVASAIEQAAGGNGYRVGGDEFLIRADSEEEAEKIAQQVKAILSGNTIAAGPYAFQPRITYGIGADMKTADAAMQQQKKRRAQQGKRADRGVEPPGVSKVSEGIAQGTSLRASDAIELLRRLNVSETQEGVIEILSEVVDDKTGQPKEGEGQVNVQYVDNVIDIEQARKNRKKSKPPLTLFASPDNINPLASIWLPDAVLNVSGDFDWDFLKPKKMPNSNQMAVPAANARKVIRALQDMMGVSPSEMAEASKVFMPEKEALSAEYIETVSAGAGVSWVSPLKMNAIIMSAAVATGRMTPTDSIAMKRISAQIDAASNAEGLWAESLRNEVRAVTQAENKTWHQLKKELKITGARLGPKSISNIVHTLGIPSVLPESRSDFVSMAKELAAIAGNGAFKNIKPEGKGSWGQMHVLIDTIRQAVDKAGLDVVTTVIAQNNGDPNALIPGPDVPVRGWATGPTIRFKLSDAESLRTSLRSVAEGTGVQMSSLEGGMLRTMDDAAGVAYDLGVNMPGVTDMEWRDNLLLSIDAASGVVSIDALSELAKMSSKKLLDLADEVYDGGDITIEEYMDIRNAAAEILGEGDMTYGVLGRPFEPFFDVTVSEEAIAQRQRSKSKTLKNTFLNVKATPDEMSRALSVVTQLMANNRNLPKVTLVPSFDELPDYMKVKFWAAGFRNGAGVRGVFDEVDPHNGVFVIVGANRGVRSFSGKQLNLEQAIAETYWHEVVGHYGIRGLFGGDVNLRLHTQAIAASMPALVNHFSTRHQYFRPYAELDEDQKQRVVEEFVAHMAGEILAERVTLSDEQRSIWERFLFWVRSKLASMGFHKFMKGPLAFSDRDLNHMIARAQDFVRNGNAWTYRFADRESVGPLTMRESEFFYSTVMDALTRPYVRKLSKADRKQRMKAGKPPNKPLFEEEDTLSKFQDSLIYAMTKGLQPEDGGEARPLSETDVEASGLMDFFENATYADVVEVYPQLDLPDIDAINASLETSRKQKADLEASEFPSHDTASHIEYLDSHIKALEAQLQSPLAKVSAERKALQDAADNATGKVAKREARAKLTAFENRLYNEKLKNSKTWRSFKFPRGVLVHWVDKHGLRVNAAMRSNYAMNKTAIRQMIKQHYAEDQVDNIAEMIERQVQAGNPDIGYGAYGLPGLFPQHERQAMGIIYDPTFGNNKVSDKPNTFSVNRATGELTLNLHPAKVGRFKTGAGPKADAFPLPGGPLVNIDLSTSADPGVYEETYPDANKLVAAANGMGGRSLPQIQWEVVESDHVTGKVVLRPAEGFQKIMTKLGDGVVDNAEMAFGWGKISWTPPMQFPSEAYSGYGIHSTGDAGLDGKDFRVLFITANRGEETFTSSNMSGVSTHYYGGNIDKNIVAHIRMISSYDAQRTPARNPLLGRKALYVIEVQQEHGQVSGNYGMFQNEGHRRFAESSARDLAMLMNHVTNMSYKAAIDDAIPNVRKFLDGVQEEGLVADVYTPGNPGSVQDLLTELRDRIRVELAKQRDSMMAGLERMAEDLGPKSSQPSGELMRGQVAPDLPPWRRPVALDDERLMDHIHWRAVWGYVVGLENVFNHVIGKLEGINEYDLESTSATTAEDGLVRSSIWPGRRVTPAQEMADRVERLFAKAVSNPGNWQMGGDYDTELMNAPGARALFEKTLVTRFFEKYWPEVPAGDLKMATGKRQSIAATRVESLPSPQVVEFSFDWETIRAAAPTVDPQHLAARVANQLNNRFAAVLDLGSREFVPTYRKEPFRLKADKRGRFMTYEYLPVVRAILAPPAIQETEAGQQASAEYIDKQLKAIQAAMPEIVSQAASDLAGVTRDRTSRNDQQIMDRLAQTNADPDINGVHTNFVRSGWYYKHGNQDISEVFGADKDYDWDSFYQDPGFNDWVMENFDPDNYSAGSDDYDNGGAYEGSSEYEEAKQQAYDEYVDNFEPDEDQEEALEIDDWEWDGGDDWIETRRGEIDDEIRDEARNYYSGSIWEQMEEDGNNQLSEDRPWEARFELEDSDGDTWEVIWTYYGGFEDGSHYRYKAWIDGDEYVETDDFDSAMRSILVAFVDLSGDPSKLTELFDEIPPLSGSSGSKKTLNVGERRGYTPEKMKRMLSKSVKLRHHKDINGVSFSTDAPPVRDGKVGFDEAYRAYNDAFKLANKVRDIPVLSNAGAGKPEPALNTTEGYKKAALAILLDAVRLGYRKVQWGAGEETVYRGGTGVFTRNSGFRAKRIEWERSSYTMLNGKQKELIHLKMPHRDDPSRIVEATFEIGGPNDGVNQRLLSVLGRAAAVELHAQYHGMRKLEDIPDIRPKVISVKPSADDVKIEQIGDSWYVIHKKWDRIMSDHRDRQLAEAAMAAKVKQAEERGWWFDESETAAGASAEENGGVPLHGGVVTEEMIGGQIAVTMSGYDSARGMFDLRSFVPTNTKSVTAHGLRLGYDLWFNSAMNKVISNLTGRREEAVKRGLRISSKRALSDQQSNYLLTAKSEGAEAAFAEKYGQLYLRQLSAGGQWVVVSEKEGLLTQDPHPTFGRAQRWAEDFQETSMEATRTMLAMPKELDIQIEDDDLAVAAVYEVEIDDELMAALQKGVPQLNRNIGTDPVLAAAVKKIGAKRKTLRERYAEFTNRWRDRFIHGMFDKFHGLKAALRDAGLGGLQAQDDPYVQARLTTSLDSVMRAAMEYGHPVWKEGIVQTEGRGLLEILKPVANNLDLWGAYMAGVRAERLKSEDRENLFTDAEIARLVLLGDQYPEFKDVAREYAEYNARLLDFAQEAGVINPDTRPLWENADYVPFYRIADDRILGPLGRNVGIAGVKSPVKTLKGGTQNVGDIVQNIMINMTNLIDSAMKNHAATMAVDALSGVGLVQKMPWKMATELVPMSQVEKVMRQHGINPAQVPANARQSLQKMFAVKPPEGEGVIPVLRDGKKEFWYTDDVLLYQSMTMINQKQWGQWMNMLRAPKRLLTATVTLDPGFMIRNFFRDLLSAFVLSRDHYVPFTSALKGMKQALFEDESYRTMMSAGAAFSSGYINQYDPKATHRAIRAATRSEGFAATVLNSPVKLYEAWKTLGSAVENANRIAVYNAAIASGKSKAQAAFESKDLMDFSMGGAWPAIQFLIQSVPFLGARMQGLHRLGRGAAENPLAFAMKGMLISMAGLALWFQFRDDERYKELEEWDKDTYFHWWIGDKHFRLPKPFEVGAIFNTIPERVFEYLYSKENDAGKMMMKRFGFMLAETFNFNPIPQMVMPAVESIFNYSFFRQRQIVSYFEQQRMGPEQYRYYTSPTMREVAGALPEWLDRFSDPPGKLRSPLHLQNVFLGYFGTLGRYALMAADAAVRNGLGYPVPPQWQVAEYPVIGSFVRGDGPRRTRYEQDFYDLLERTMQVKNSLNFLKDQGEIDRYMSLTDEQMPLVAISKSLEGYRKSIGKLNEGIMRVYTDPNMTPEAKRELIDEYQTQKNELFRSAYDLRPGGSLNPETPSEDDISFLLDKFGVDEMKKELATRGKPATASLVNDIQNLSTQQRESLGP